MVSSASQRISDRDLDDIFRPVFERIAPGATDEAALDAVELAAAQAQLGVIDTVLTATTDLFEVGGASITSEDLRLDRHWRNARTISVHNPANQKARAIGDHLLNGAPLPFAWSAGSRQAQR